MDDRRGTPSGDGRGRGRGTGRSGGRGGDPRGGSARDGFGGRGEAPRASRGGARANPRGGGERRGGPGGERRGGERWNDAADRRGGFAGERGRAAGGRDGDRRRDDRKADGFGGPRGRAGSWGGDRRDRQGSGTGRGSGRDSFDDEIQTIGGVGDGRPAATGRRDGFRAARPGLTRARYGRSADRERAPYRPAARDRDDEGRRDRAAGGGRRGGTPFKSAAQPIRDDDMFPAGYTDERDTTEVPDGIRLQKVLAGAGVASRRACEEMIGEGRVTVDGQVVRRFGARVDPARQVIRVDGKRIPTAPDLVYYAINKPIGVISTMSDPEGRPSLADYVSDLPKRLFHVGRLDTETEGLIILTNDGELAHRLTHPSYGVQKKYWAKVPGPIPRDLARRLKQGVELEDGIARADEFKVVQEHARQALVEIVLHEGRKHIVRRMMEEVGHRVIDLARIEFGPVKLGRLKPGTIRSLTVTEVGDLYAAVGL